MPGRKSNTGDYRYGFNGKEDDRDWGMQNIQDYGFRLYNPSIGKFLSVDPLAPSYPWYTPYQFAGNKPIRFIDLDGLEEAEPFGLKYKAKALLDKIGADWTNKVSGTGNIIFTSSTRTLTSLYRQKDINKNWDVFRATSFSDIEHLTNLYTLVYGKPENIAIADHGGSTNPGGSTDDPNYSTMDSGLDRFDSEKIISLNREYKNTGKTMNEEYNSFSGILGNIKEGGALILLHCGTCKDTGHFAYSIAEAAALHRTENISILMNGDNTLQGLRASYFLDIGLTSSSKYKYGFYEAEVSPKDYPQTDFLKITQLYSTIKFNSSGEEAFGRSYSINVETLEYSKKEETVEHTIPKS
jgi:RHS repeat-associated protein